MYCRRMAIVNGYEIGPGANLIGADFIDNMINDAAWWFFRVAIRASLTLIAFVVLVRVIHGLWARSHAKPSHAATPTPPPGPTEAADTGRDTPTLTEGAHPTRAPRGGQTHRTTEPSWPPPVTPPQ